MCVVLHIKYTNLPSTQVYFILVTFESITTKVTGNTWRDIPSPPPPKTLPQLVWSSRTQEVWVIELTVCFETSYEEAQNRMTTRYADLLDQINNLSFDACLRTLEGSCGFISLPNFITIKQQLLECSKKHQAHVHACTCTWTSTAIYMYRHSSV